MAIFNTTKKDLDTLIREAREKKQKVSQQIKSLEAQKKDIEFQIEKQTDQLVDCELEGDIENLSIFQTSLERLRNDLAGYDGRINSYRKVLQKGVLNDKEAKEIRAAIKSEAEDRVRRVKPLKVEKDKAEKQIKALQDRIKEIESEVSRIYSEGNYLQQGIKNILDCIDPRAEKLEYSDQERFIKNWIGGAPTEQYFEPKPESKGLTYTQRYVDIEETEADKEAKKDKEVIQVSYSDVCGIFTTKYMTRKEAREKGLRESR